METDYTKLYIVVGFLHLFYFYGKNGLVSLTANPNNNIIVVLMAGAMYFAAIIFTFILCVFFWWVLDLIKLWNWVCRPAEKKEPAI